VHEKRETQDTQSLPMVRAARNQALCRDVNERIEELAESFAVEISYRNFICECADTECSEPIRMTVAEYEAVRADPTLFVVFPSAEHVVPAVEDVVSRDERYWTVGKLGVAAEVAAKLDPRAR
jgi:hypothetical protein